MAIEPLINIKNIKKWYCLFLPPSFPSKSLNLKTDISEVDQLLWISGCLVIVFMKYILILSFTFIMEISTTPRCIHHMTNMWLSEGKSNQIRFTRFDWKSLVASVSSCFAGAWLFGLLCIIYDMFEAWHLNKCILLHRDFRSVGIGTSLLKGNDSATVYKGHTAFKFIYIHKFISGHILKLRDPIARQSD